MSTISTKTKVAIIGLGKIGKAISKSLTKGNHPVILASRDSEKTKGLVEQLGNLATAKEIT